MGTSLHVFIIGLLGLQNKYVTVDFLSKTNLTTSFKILITLNTSLVFFFFTQFDVG